MRITTLLFVLTKIASAINRPKSPPFITSNPNTPFKDDGITKEDVYRILEESGVGLPEYYKWRTRSGCYFCFFQRKSEWVGLLEQHPELFKLAKAV